MNSAKRPPGSNGAGTYAKPLGRARVAAGDPLLTFVVYMCAYAREVLTGGLPGAYSDHDARRFARAALVPEELGDPDRIAHTHRNLQRTARALKLPAAELAAALADTVHARAAQPQEAYTRPLRRAR